MGRMRRRAMVPKNTTAKHTQTTAMAMSKGHSSSAYSLPPFQPARSEMPPASTPACQARAQNQASPGANSGTWQVRCTL